MHFSMQRDSDPILTLVPMLEERLSILWDYIAEDPGGRGHRVFIFLFIPLAGNKHVVLV